MALAICAALLSTNRLLAQSGGNASAAGIVSEKKSGELITGATITLLKDTTGNQQVTGEKIRGAISNKYGFFSIPGIAPGSYILSIRSIGHQTQRIPITIADGKSVRVDVQLEMQDLQQNGIVVEGTKERSSTASISRVEIRPEFIQQLPAIGGETDIFRALQLLPGVKSVSEISSGLYVRGGSPDQNLTLLDGVIVYNPTHLGGFLSTFNSDAVRDIKLIKGAFPAEYGGRLSSVLDMTMREGTKEKISGTAGVSLINSRLTVEGPITDNATFMLSARRMYLDLMLLAVSNPDSVPRYYFYDFNGKINYRLSESDRIFLSGYSGRDVLNGPPADRDKFEIGWGNLTANARWMHIVSPTLFTNFSAIVTDYDFSTFIQTTDNLGNPSSGFKSVSGIRDYVLRAEAQYFPNDDHVIKAGLEGTEHRFRADATSEILDFGKIDQTPTILKSLDASLYLQDEWKISPLFSTNIGARFYYFQKGNYVRLEPRISAAYNLTENVSLKGAFSTGNQFLHLITRNDIPLPTDVWFPSTTTIKPSESYQGVLGLESYFDDRTYLFTVEGYYKKMKNLLEYKDTVSLSLDVPLETSFTAGDGDAYGLEFFLNKQIGSFTGWLGYTLAWTQRTFPELNGGKPFYPRYDRRHDISVVLTYKLGESWEMGATWVYGTGQAFTMA
ncbi:MAG: TonB-dependent receptor, partial [Bacteroidota bacterium]